ncbi:MULTISPECIES: UvrD-helicase domain-containing protein [Pseudoalteromonas]|uniref:UvrD-helicase domain-containing protein n=1 Tax=Pseudoalteromonas TaxID=53246 RepID=UPI00030DE081|nr:MULTISPECIES: UvrD-helicase domain-containing protein [Pseudoalteromonas]MCF6142736.1 DNA helicase IV [Pseudoalteromonas mariniglutinosa NCIMB 1770]
MNSIPVSLFGLMFASKARLAFDEHVLVIRQGNTVTSIEWGELLAPLSFSYGVFGQTIRFATAEQNYTFLMRAYGIHRQIKASCEQYWLQANVAKLNAVLTKISQFVELRYLRQSHVASLKQAARDEYKRWLPWVKQSPVLSLVANKITLLEQYANWHERLTQHLQQRYLTKQLKLHAHFFDSVESNPLTHSQRQACIIDDDNNLLLAGAGTGKTSVMIGRAGFLVTSQQAQYSDILLLAYGRKAADEMDERIQTKLATDKIKAATFHSIGLAIIAKVENAKPSMSVLAQDEQAKAKWVQQSFESLIDNNERYRTLVLDYFSKYYYVEKNEVDFKTLGDYYSYLNDNDIRSLKGDKVKSFGELYIANWLFYHGIDYQYEAPYKVAVKTIDRSQYKPDFYLPEYDIYIEYYGIDEAGNTAPYIDKTQYHEAMDWKNTTHASNNTHCIALTYGQHKQGILLSELEQALKSVNVHTQMLPVESLLASLKETGRVTVLATLFAQLLGLYKGTCLSAADEVKVIKRSLDAQQTTQALALLKPILSHYNTHLQQRGEIDFEDMIIKAIEYVESGKFHSPWRYIMVDEFQDISEPRARLVKALRDSRKGCSVFAVGDDWQAIYRFSGADIKLTTQFKTYFGFTTEAQLDTTFRFNNKIGEVASAFISKNPAQLNKTITSLTQVQQPAVSILRRGKKAPTTYNYYQSELAELANGAIDDVLGAIYSTVCKPTSVYFLARFWFQLPSNADITAMQLKYPLLKIQSQTFHAAKGKEADHVIIIGLQKGKHGFPSEKATPAILEALLPAKEAFTFAEERRLFYVALTRAKQRAYIIADMTNSSCFVTELIAEHNIELHEFSTDNEQFYSADINCMRCNSGVLKKQTGRFGVFYSCSHYPHCEHKEKPCQQCQSPMTRSRYAGFKACVNESCNHIQPICDKCGAEMVLRQSAKGLFWGCKNYQGNEPLSCKNGKDSKAIKWPEQV